MGRVARYKKIKTCDPFSKKNAGRVNMDHVGVWGLGDDGRKAKKRSLKAQKLREQKLKKKRRIDDKPSESRGGFDAPPQEDDDFNLDDIAGSIRKQKKPKALLLDEKDGGESSLKPVQSAKHSIREERKIHRILKLDERVNAEKKESTELERKEGEGFRDFKRRLNQEVQQQIKKEREQKKNPERMEKKKEFLKNKKKKGKRKGFSESDSSRYEEDDEDLVTGDGARDILALKEDFVPFGEQVERPPTFRQLPRGAKSKEIGEEPAGKKSKLMDEDDVRAEQNAMEILRRKVQAQYKLIRQKRSREFHL